MWPRCRNVKRGLMAGLLALSGLAQAAASAETESSLAEQQAQLMKGAYLEPPFVCDALSDPQLYQDGAMSGMRQLVSGKPYWFFRTDVDLQEDFPVSAMARGELGELVEILREKDLQLVVMLQPTRGLMHADQLVQPWRGRYPLTDVRRSYLRKAELFRDLGAMVADMEPVLEKVDGGEYFFRRDHHWTPAGADVSAYQVAQVVLCHADESSDQGSEDHSNSQETEEGHVLVNDCSVYYGADEKGRRQADKGGSHDQEEYETCLGLVRHEVAEHSPDGDRGYGHRRLRGVST